MRTHKHRQQSLHRLRHMCARKHTHNTHTHTHAHTHINATRTRFTVADDSLTLTIRTSKQMQTIFHASCKKHVHSERNRVLDSWTPTRYPCPRNPCVQHGSQSSAEWAFPAVWRCRCISVERAAVDHVACENGQMWLDSCDLETCAGKSWSQAQPYSKIEPVFFY